MKISRGVRGRVAAGVKEDIKEIMSLVAKSNKPQQMVGTVRNGQISQPSGAGLIRVQGKDVIQPGDAVTIVANSSTHLATHVDISTKFDGGPMTVAQDYGQLPDGPNVMKNMKVSVPGKDLVINVSSYDYTLQTSRLNKTPQQLAGRVSDLNKEVSINKYFHKGAVIAPSGT